MKSLVNYRQIINAPAMLPKKRLILVKLLNFKDFFLRTEKSKLSIRRYKIRLASDFSIAKVYGILRKSVTHGYFTQLCCHLNKKRKQADIIEIENI